MPKSSFKFLLQKDKLTEALTKTFTKNSWNFDITKNDEKETRLEVSDLKNKIPVIIYSNGTILPQGQNCPLREAVKQFLEAAENKPTILVEENIPSAQEHNKRITVYKIANKTIKDDILKEISLFSTKQNLKPPNSSIEYRLKLKEGQLEIVITQYNNGTLLLQGKADSLWDKICSIVEQKADLTEKEVAGRFVSKNTKDIERVVKIMTDELVIIAKNKAEEFIGSECYNFLNEWDCKYLVSSFCLLEADLQYLPEYSCIVMPIAKSYEGFLKKILIDVELTNKTEIAKKDWNFGKVWGDSTYKTYIDKNRYRKAKMDELKNTLEIARHFSMHSDGSALTQIENLGKAKEKIDHICSVMKSGYDFFVRDKGKG